MSSCDPPFYSFQVIKNHIESFHSFVFSVQSCESLTCLYFGTAGKRFIPGLLTHRWNVVKNDALRSRWKDRQTSWIDDPYEKLCLDTKTPAFSVSKKGHELRHGPLEYQNGLLFESDESQCVQPAVKRLCRDRLQSAPTKRNIQWLHLKAHLVY